MCSVSRCLTYYCTNPFIHVNIMIQFSSCNLHTTNFTSHPSSLAKHHTVQLSVNLYYCSRCVLDILANRCKGMLVTVRIWGEKPNAVKNNRCHNHTFFAPFTLDTNQLFLLWVSSITDTFPIQSLHCICYFAYIVYYSYIGRIITWIKLLF